MRTLVLVELEHGDDDDDDVATFSVRKFHREPIEVEARADGARREDGSIIEGWHGRTLLALARMLSGS